MQGGDQRGQHCAVTLNAEIHSQLFTQVKDRRTVIAERPANDNFIARLNLSGPPAYCRRNHTNASGINKNFVGRTALNDFGIARHDGDPCLPRRPGHTADDAL